MNRCSLIIVAFVFHFVSVNGQTQISVADSLRIDSLVTLSRQLSDSAKYEEAIRVRTEALNLQESFYGKENGEYAKSLSGIANYNYFLQKYNEAIRIGTIAMEIRKRIYGAEHPEYVTSLNNLAVYNSYIDNYSEAIRYGTEAMEIRKRVLGTEHPDYVTSLDNLARYNYNIGNYSEAVRLGTEVKEIFKKLYGTKHPDYTEAVSNLSNYYSELGNDSKAIRQYTESKELYKKVTGREHLDHAKYLINLAKDNRRLGNYSEAVRLGKEAMEIYKRVLGPEHPDYAMSLHNLANYYYYIGNYSEALRLGIDAKEIYKKLYGTEHHDYAICISNLADANKALGNYTEALRLGTEAIEILKKLYGTEHPDYARFLISLANYNNALGNYSEALRLGTDAKEIFKKLYGTKHPDYACCLINLANYNYYIGNNPEALRLGTEAKEIYKKMYGTEYPDYASCLFNLANYNCALDNYSEALHLGIDANEIIKKMYGTDHPIYALSIGNLAHYNSALGNYSEASCYGSVAKELIKDLYGREHPNYAQSLSNLAGYNSYLGNYYEAANLISQSTDITENHVLKIFTDVSSYMRNQYWEKNKDGIIKRFPEYVYRSKTHIGDLYDKSALFAKGLLLNADTELGKLIAESGDTLALKKLEELRTTRSILSKLYEKPIAERFLDTDSLEQLERRQEADLMRMSKVYGDFTRNLRMTWRDVQKSMKAGEVAIEFLSFPLNEDSTMYIALTLKPGYDCPKMTTLCEEKQLTSVPRDDIYTTPAMYQALWQPLEEELKDVKTVYFSPSGALYNIGIEYLPTEDGSGIYEHYDLYRLSSTRQIALEHNKKKDGTAVLYGGIRYDADTKSLESENRQYAIERGSNWNSTFVGSTRALDDSSLRGGCGYLPGTKIEVDNISSTLTDNGVTNKAYTDIQGTEESFKALGGTRPDILHIATHGFYWTESDAEKVARLHDAMRFLQTDNGDRATVEDKALTRSGLMMAGSNRTINGERLPDGVDDGILTAKEISQVDLRGCDLVVLSACQTALGDVSGSEGVFGLQRAFKKSGVQTLLMSMWKVDDTATQIMMTEFYQNLASGMSKRRAFLEAQQSLHDVDDDPSHWAAFVMLDAIE